MKPKRILLFSPFQGIPQHTFIEKKISEILGETARYVADVMTCDGLLSSFCSVMAASGLTPSSTEQERLNICKLCKRYKKDLYGRDFAGSAYSLDSFASSSILDEMKTETKRIDEELQNYNFDGVSLGRISSYEFILSNKLKNLDSLSEINKREFSIIIRNNLLVYLTMQAFLENNAYDIIIFYNGNYVVNNTVSALVKKDFPQTKINPIHYGLNWAALYDKLYFIRGRHQEHLWSRMKYFEENLSNLDFESYDEKELEEYLNSLFNAKSMFVYSAARSGQTEKILKGFDLSSSKPTAMLSLASTDEIFALRYAIFQQDSFDWVKSTFVTQEEWIERTVEFFRTHNEFQLIIRIHPREFPNKRERVLSKSVAFYEDIQKRLPPNVVFNLPAQKISIHDLFPLIHLHLTSWSSVGLESSLQGIPTIASTKGYGLYPCDYVHDFFTDAEKYFNRISYYLQGPLVRDADQIQRAKNWLLYEFNQTVVRYTTQKFWESLAPFYERVVRKIKKKLTGPVPVFSYKRFSQKMIISSEEKKVMVDFFDSSKDVFEIKSNDKANNGD